MTKDGLECEMTTLQANIQHLYLLFNSFSKLFGSLCNLLSGCFSNVEQIA